ncbi:MAG TPA: carboxypeptidase-like regulatory domain-containing protein [Thermoanaerobaculia bacterium]
MRGANVALVVVLVGSVVGSGGAAEACSCVWALGNGQPCEMFHEGALVFLGHTVGEPVERQRTQWPERVYTFAVEEAFWGVEGTTVEVLSGMGGGDCGIEFAAGESYFVHAWHRQYDGAVYAGLCGGTTRASAARDELRYARRRLAGEPVTALYGRVVRKTLEQEEWEAGTGLPGVRIAVAGPGGQRRATSTGAGGLFVLVGPLPGELTVSAAIPGGAGRPIQEQVEVPVDGCTGVELVVRE